MAVFVFGCSSYLFVNDELGWFWMTLLNSLAIYASFTPLHDATHRTVSSNRKLNDFLGTVSCLLLLPGITTRIYRYLHLEHHRYAGDSEKDPDEPFVSARGVNVVFTLAGLDLLWTRWYLMRWQTRPVTERVEFVASISFYVVIHIVGFASPYAMEFLLVWVVPQRLALFYVSWFFARIQHPENVRWEKSPFQTTVQVVTNGFAKVMLLGQANHHVHHFAPSLPWYRYAKAWELGKDRLLDQNIPTRTLFFPSVDFQLPEVENSARLEARVKTVTDVANDVRCFELVPKEPEGGINAWPAFSAGAHIDLDLASLRPDYVGFWFRQYSLCNSPAEKNRYVIAVKRETDGRGGSALIHSRLAVGDCLNISKPRNNFSLRPSDGRLLLIAGGIGLTPLLSMAHDLHERRVPFELHLCSSTPEALAFHESLPQLPFANSIKTHYSNTAVRDAAFEQATSRSASRAFDPRAVLGGYSKGAALYLCGPTGFMAWIMRQASELDWPDDAIYSENFVSSQTDVAANSAFEVELARSGKVLYVGADESLLDVLNANDCAVICSCTQGICGSCMTPVLEGEPLHRDALMTQAERATNTQMTVCVSRAVSDRLVLDL